MHIYAFGSICRGEIFANSDIDLLAIVDGQDDRFDPDSYSVYSYQRLGEIWAEGNPFAWHLNKESTMLFSQDGRDFLKSLGEPSTYKYCLRDCLKFYKLFSDASSSLSEDTTTRVFDLSMAFLGIRNFATCFSLGCLKTPDFSRNSALRLGLDSLPIAVQPYAVLERARILCTRGIGPVITDIEADLAIRAFSTVDEWMGRLLLKVPSDE